MYFIIGYLANFAKLEKLLICFFPIVEAGFTIQIQATAE